MESRERDFSVNMRKRNLATPYATDALIAKDPSKRSNVS